MSAYLESLAAAFEASPDEDAKAGVVDLIARVEAETPVDYRIKLRALAWCRAGVPVQSTEDRIIASLIRDAGPVAPRGE